MRMRIIAAAMIGYCLMMSSTNATLVVAIWNGLSFVLLVTTKRGLGLYIDVLLGFESEIKVSATRIRDTPL